MGGGVTEVNKDTKGEDGDMRDKTDGGCEPGHKGWDMRDRGVRTWGPGGGDERSGRELCEFTFLEQLLRKAKKKKKSSILA